MARAVVLQAWDFILDRIGRICSAQKETKCTTDCVTELDRISETPIVDAIGKRFPDYHIVAEETSDKVLQRGATWIIDPLDATTNFIHGFPFVAVSISVCIEQQLLSGFVLEAVHQDFFTATKERSAFDKKLHKIQKILLELRGKVQSKKPQRTDSGRV